MNGFMSECYYNTLSCSTKTQKGNFRKETLFSIEHFVVEWCSKKTSKSGSDTTLIGKTEQATRCCFKNGNFFKKKFETFSEIQRY